MIQAARNAQEQATLLAYLAERSGETPSYLVGDMPFNIVGVVRGNRILGAICFLNFRRTSMEFHLCGSPGWLSRREIKWLFSYVFCEAKCLRLWCCIRRNNKQARVGAERLGFKVAGVADDEFGEGRDGIVYSMTRAQCQWLK